MFFFLLLLLDLAQSEKAMARMNGRPVYCIRCGMWEFLETTCLPEVHICARCVELQLLREHVRELELRLDDLSLVRQNEKFIDRSYRQVVTPGSWKDDMGVPVRRGYSQKGDVPESTPVAVSHKRKGWETNGKREGSEQSVDGSPGDVPIQNTYIVLDSVEGDDPPGVNHEDLEVRVRELELELEELRIIREAEAAFDKSYREIVTPKREAWVTARRDKKQSVQRSPVAVPLQNRYSVLDAVAEEDSTEVNQGVQVLGGEPVLDAQVGKGRKSRVLVIGDSMVKGTDRRFCGKERDSRLVCCLPGARVNDVSDRVFDILKGEGNQPQVVVHVGTHDIGRKKDEDVRQNFRELGWKLRAKTNSVVISGVLPVPRDSEERNRERELLNLWLKGWCRREGFRYLDNWGSFWGRWDLYKRDGLHLSLKGTNILGGKFANALRGGLN